MQPAGAKHRPPPMCFEYRNGSAGAKQEQTSKAGRKKVKESAATYALGIRDQRQQEEDDAGPQYQWSEAEIAAEAVQKRSIAPQSGIPSTTRKATLIFDADEIAAGRSHYRAPRLPQHEEIMTWRSPLYEPGMGI